MEDREVDFSRARERIREKGFGRDFDTRRQIQKQLSDSIDEPPRRASGRYGQLNIRCRAEIKATAQRLARARRLKMVDWFELMVEEATARDAGGDDA